MRRTLLTGLIVGLLTIAMAVPALASNGKSDQSSGRPNTENPVILVTSTGLYYDSIVKADLPMQGRFQQLIPTPEGLTTEFGPGDKEFVGGRWWLDANMDGVMNVGDAFFLCPLLGPGRDHK